MRRATKDEVETAKKEGTYLDAKLRKKEKRDGKKKARITLCGAKEQRITWHGQLANMADATDQKILLADVSRRNKIELQETGRKKTRARLKDVLGAYLLAPYQRPDGTRQTAAARLPKIIANIVGYTDALIVNCANGVRYGGAAWQAFRDARLQKRGYVPNLQDSACFRVTGLKTDEPVALTTHADDFTYTGAPSAITEATDRLRGVLPLEGAGFETPEPHLEVHDILGWKVTHNAATGKISIPMQKYLEKALKAHQIPGKQPYPMTQGLLGRAVESTKGAEETNANRQEKFCLAGASGWPCRIRYDTLPAFGFGARLKATAETVKLMEGIMCYYTGATDLNLVFDADPGAPTVRTQTDADFASQKDRRSISCQVTWYHGRCIKVNSKVQKVVATPSTEAEVISSFGGWKENKAAENFVRTMGLASPSKRWKPVPEVDSNPCLCYHAAGGPTEGNKHLEAKYRAVSQDLAAGNFTCNKTPRTANTADSGCKLVVGAQFHRRFEELGMKQADLRPEL